MNLSFLNFRMVKTFLRNKSAFSTRTTGKRSKKSGNDWEINCGKLGVKRLRLLLVRVILVFWKQDWNWKTVIVSSLLPSQVRYFDKFRRPFSLSVGQMEFDKSVRIHATHYVSKDFKQSTYLSDDRFREKFLIINHFFPVS